MYAVGFIAAQYLTVWLFREAVSGFVEAPFTGALTLRFFVVSIIEAGLAIAAFAIGLRGLARLSRSFAASVLGLIVGVVACSVTVGAWPLVPRITQGDAQLLLQAAAGAIISYVFGVAMSKMFREGTANDG